MSKHDVVFYLILMIILGIVTVYFLFGEVTLDRQYIPTIINGLTTSISIMIGFTITAISIMIRREDREPLKKEPHSFELVIGLLDIPALLLFLMYALLVIENEFESAVKMGMLDLYISVMILLVIWRIFYNRTLGK